MDNAPKLRHFLFIESEYFWKKSIAFDCFIFKTVKRNGKPFPFTLLFRITFRFRKIRPFS